MGAGFASGLSRFGQVAGPGIQHAMGTREQLIRNALEKAFREKQIQGLETENLIKSGNLTKDIADLEAYLQPSARAGRATALENEQRVGQVAADFALPKAQEDLAGAKVRREGGEIANQGAANQQMLDEMFSEKERKNELAMNKLKRKAMEFQIDFEAAIDPAEKGRIAHELQKIQLEGEKQKVQNDRARTLYMMLKEQGGGVKEKPMAVETRQALKGAQDNLAALGSIEKPDPLNPKKAVKMNIVSPGATNNLVGGLYRLAQSGDRKRFDAYAAMNAKALTDRIFSSPDKKSELLREYKQGVEKKPLLWTNKEIGKTPGISIPYGTKFEDFVKQRKAEAMQAIRDEAEAVWTAGQGGQTKAAAGFKLPDLPGGKPVGPAPEDDDTGDTDDETGVMLDFIAEFKKNNQDATDQEALEAFTAAFPQ